MKLHRMLIVISCMLAVSGCALTPKYQLEKIPTKKIDLAVAVVSIASNVLITKFSTASYLYICEVP